MRKRHEIWAKVQEVVSDRKERGLAIVKAGKRENRVHTYTGL